MRRTHLLGFLVVLSIVVVGCSKQAPVVVVQAPQSTAPAGDTVTSAIPVTPISTSLGELPPANSAQAKYDALLTAALNALAEREYTDALTVLEAAQMLQDTEQVRQEIAHVKALLMRKEAADKTVQEIRTVLKDGNADDAGRLATAGLQQFGGSDEAERLAQLKQQADAVSAASVDDRQARLTRFVREGDAAFNEQNLRAAAIAYEQAIEAGAAAEVRQRLDDVRARLTRYDEQRRRASELRRDLYQIEDAIAALQEAQRAWDTVQVRQDLDDYNLALQKRRERISVADFEVRGDVGIPFAGRTMAEELLPAFRPRFDVVERAQLAKVIEELKLEASDLADDAGRREVSRLSRVRYMVLGSVSALGGVTVSARLVDLRTGLIIQTGKVSGATPEEAISLLPQLAQMLTMNDAERIALENQLAQKVPPIAPIVPRAALPPPPIAPPDADQPVPPPVVVFSPRPPDFGGLQIADFNALPFAGGPPPTVVIVEREDPCRRRLLSLVLHLGDNLFRRRRFHEAHAQFVLALNLAPGEGDIRLRIDRCRPFLPPVVVVPSPVVIAPPVFFAPPVVVVRPRIAVLSFFVNADPRFAPPGFGDWAADHFASQFYPYYDVVDRGQLFWYMGQLGLSVRDVVVNPAARWALAQALNVRFFVVGAIQQTASFQIDSHLVDAQTGARQGIGSIHVQDQQEMKLRMNELVHQLRNDPSKRDELQKEAQENERQLNEVRRLLKEGKAAQAVDVGRKALEKHPNDVALRTMVDQAERQAQQTALAEARRREAEQRQAQELAARKRQDELAKQGEAARQRAEQEGKGRDDAGRRAREQQRDRAHDQLIAQANGALGKKDYAQAILALQSAVALKPTDAAHQELAKARAEQEQAAKLKAADEQKRVEAEKVRKQQDELAKARTQMEAQRKAREADDLARRKVQEERDQTAYARRVADAQNFLKQERYDAALGALQAARQVKATDEVAHLIEQVQDRKAKADAEKKGAEAKAALDKKLAEEKAARDRADADAKLKQDQYAQALQHGQKALLDKHYDEAIRQFQEAGKLFSTDAVLNGLRQAQEAKRQEAALLDADKRKKADEEQRAAKVKQLLTEGQAALQAKQYDKAIKTFTEAKQLAPTNVDVLAALGKADHARDDAAAEARRPKEDTDRLARFRKLVDDGKAKLAAKQYDGAALALNDALRLKPGDAEATALLKDVDKARAGAAADTKTQADAKLKAEEHQKLLADARLQLAAKKYDEAIKTLHKAQELFPKDQTTVALLQEADKAKRDQDTARTDAEALKKKQAEFAADLAKARQALAAKRFDAALQALADADKLIPNDKDALALRKEIDKAKADAQAEEVKKQDELKRRTEYTRQMTIGQQAMTAKRYGDAAKAYGEALKLQPGDAAATKALTEAQNAAKAPPPMPQPKPMPLPKPPTAQEEYGKQMQAAAAAEKQQKWDDAVKAYKEALRLLPGDAKASAALTNADYQQHMAAGQKAAKDKKFPDAVKEYEAALKLKPNDPAATDALKRAKAGKP